MHPDPKTAIYFDGACPLCRAEIDLYRRRDHRQRLAFVDVAASCAVLPPGLSREAALARFHAMTSDGELLSGAAAFAEVWRHFPGWRWAGRIAALPVVAPLAEITYRIFLSFRPLFVRAFVVVRQMLTGLAGARHRGFRGHVRD